MKRTYILYNETNEHVADYLRNEYFFDKKIYSKDLTITEETLMEMCAFIGSPFYVIVPTDEIEFVNFDFSFDPPDWDKKYVHFWNNDTIVRLYDKKSVQSNPYLYTDKAMYEGLMPMKRVPDSIWNKVPLDIIFLSYDELHANENFNKLKSRFPRAKRINKIKGILEAHKTAARISESGMFYVVDADAEIMDNFSFNFSPHSVDRETVHIWHSKNPVNGLEYGYGGVKLFPRNLLLKYNGSPVDFTTSLSGKIKIMKEISNITKFNVDPFSTWRSAFRECTKLSSRIIHNQDDSETDYRLNIWCSVADGEFGEFSVMGAIQGRQYGIDNANSPVLLKYINDFDWLKKRFSES